MKRMIVFLLIVLIVLSMLSLIGCGSNSTNEGNQIRTPDGKTDGVGTSTSPYDENNHSDECPT